MTKELKEAIERLKKAEVEVDEFNHPFAVVVPADILTLIKAVEAIQPRPIVQAVEDERIIALGYQPLSGNVAGYWWLHEDIAGEYADHPRATHFIPLSALPTPPGDPD